MKKIYVAPFVEKVEFTFNDKVLSSTVEEFKSYIDGPPEIGETTPSLMKTILFGEEFLYEKNYNFYSNNCNNFRFVVCSSYVAI